MLLKISILFLFALVTMHSVLAQDYKTSPGYKFSKEDMHEIYLDKSRSQKTKAIIAATAGPAFIVLGTYIAHKSGPEIRSAGGGYIGVQASSGEIIGGSIGVLGIAVTLYSIPLFISSAKNKKKAALVLKDESVSFLNRSISVPGVTLRFNL